MTDDELDKKVRNLRKLKELSKDIEDDIEKLKDEIKTEMLRRRIDNINGTDWRIIWREHTYTRLDAKRLEEDFGDLSKYKKTTTYKSFYLKDR